MKRNIVENEFATENEDYWRLVYKDESPTGGIVWRDDYSLTAHFARKLSMKGTGKKAELARDYFAIVEEKAKEYAQKQVDRSTLSDNLQMFYRIADSLAQQELEQKRQAERIAEIERKQNTLCEAVSPITENWRQSITKRLNAIQAVSNIPFKQLRFEVYTELDRRAGVNTAQRLKNRRDRMREDGMSITAINNTNRMDIIEDDKKLREIFGKIVEDYQIKYLV